MSNMILLFVVFPVCLYHSLKKMSVYPSTFTALTKALYVPTYGNISLYDKNILLAFLFMTMLSVIASFISVSANTFIYSCGCGIPKLVNNAL